MTLFSRTIMRAFGAVLFGCALSVASQQEAVAVPVLSGQTLRVEFGFASAPDIGIPQLPPDDVLRTPTVLQGLLNATWLGGFGQPSASFALYDGDDLLGSFTLAFDGFTNFAFSAPGGVYTSNAGSASDFSSIANGTIDGVLLITNTGPADLDLSVLALEAGYAFTSNGYYPFSPVATITDQRVLIEISEPTGAAAMLGVLLALVTTQRRFRSRCQG